MNRRPAYATDAQMAYLRRLINRAFVLRVDTGFGPLGSRDILMSEASKLIGMAKAAVEKAEDARKPVTGGPYSSDS